MDQISSKLSKYKKIGILGLGITGKSVRNFFINHGIDVVCWDDNQKARDEFLATEKNSNIQNYEDWTNCSHIIVSPGISLAYPKKHKILEIAEKIGAEITSDNEILYDLTSDKAKFIAITGTNGKSTTTALIGHILTKAKVNCSVGGNIGVCALDLPLDSDYYVLELSSYQLEILKSFKAHVSIILNITPDHLERYKTMENYSKAKQNIFNNQTKDDFAILGIDNPITAWIYEELKHRKNQKTVGISGSEEYVSTRHIISCDTDIIYDNEWGEETKLQNNIYLQGRHNRENIAASYAACKAIGLDSEIIAKHIKSFVGLPHRMQYIGDIRNLSFYNDSKATNAEASLPALTSLENIYWLAGGKAKQDGINILLDSLSNVKKAYLFGDAAEEFAHSLNKKIPFEVFMDLNSALKKATEDAFAETSRSVILLSPSASSLDQYKNFEQRGEHFIQLYKNLKMVIK